MALALSTQRRSSNRPSRILRALTAVAIALAGTLNAIHLSGAANMQAPAQVDPSTLAIARDMCRARSSSSSIVSGLHLQWVGGTSERLPEVLRQLRDRPSINIATSRNWAAVYDVLEGIVTRLRCSDNTARSDRLAGFTSQLAVSEFGDLAAASPVGEAVILGLGTGPASVRYEVPAQVQPGSSAARQPRGLVWVDRRLFVIGDIQSQVVTVGADGYVTSTVNTTTSEDSAANQRFSVVPLGGFLRAFSYNGQIFAERSDGCFDLFADRTLSPRIRDVACLASNRSERYVVFDDASAQVVLADGTRVWQGPRVLGLAGRVDGNRETIGQAVQRVQATQWLPQNPLPLGGERRSRPEDERAQWNAAYKATIDLAQTNYKGGDAVKFPTDRGWLVNGTVALRWQTGPESVTPTGAPLSAFAGTRYHLGKYTDDDLTNIVRSNASLERSLEGRLFLTGFVPIGALFGGGKNAPVIVASQDWLERAPLKRTTLTLVPSDVAQVFRQIGRCDLANPAPFPALTRFLANGVSVVGDLGGDLLPLPPTSDLRLRAEKVGIVTCFRDSNRPLKLVVLEGVAASGEQLHSVSANQPRITAYGITFQRVLDDEWPLQLVGPVVAGIMVDETEEGKRGRLDAQRMWLDDIFAQRRVSRLLLTVSYLDLFFAADTMSRERAPAISNVRFVSGERVAASARAVCSPPDDALTRQQRYEKLIRLKPFSAENRSVEGTYVGVVENAVRLMDARFVDNGTTIWRTLKDGDRLVELNEPPANMSQNPDDLLHGTRVAAVIYSKVAPPGLVASPRLMWLDAGRPDGNALTRLSGERPVVNVSQELQQPGWESLLKQTNDLGILFVAAAHNPNQGSDGLPLKLRLPNIIGVGVVDDNGNTPESLLKTYDRFQVDLLAPGFLVPVVGEPAPECVDGASFASPYVTAVATMIASRAQASPTQIKARMLATATWQDRLGPFVRGGIINAARALDDMFRRVLTFQDPQDPEKPGLVVTVELDDTDFLASGFESGRTRDSRNGLPDRQLRLNWKEILRLTRTGQRPDSQGRMRPVFRMVFVHEKKYQVWDDVSVLQADSAMPISTCLRYDDRTAVQCRGSSIDTVFDYVGRIFTRTPIDAF